MARFLLTLFTPFGSNPTRSQKLLTMECCNRLRMGLNRCVRMENPLLIGERVDESKKNWEGGGMAKSIDRGC